MGRSCTPERGLRARHTSRASTAFSPCSGRTISGLVPAPSGGVGGERLTTKRERVCPREPPSPLVGGLAKALEEPASLDRLRIDMPQRRGLSGKDRQSSARVVTPSRPPSRATAVFSQHRGRRASSVRSAIALPATLRPAPERRRPVDRLEDPPRLGPLRADQRAHPPIHVGRRLKGHPSPMGKSIHRAPSGDTLGTINPRVSGCG